MSNKGFMQQRNRGKKRQNSFPPPVNGIQRLALPSSEVMLTNKECFIVDSCCPICYNPTQSIEAKFEAPFSYWLYRTLQYCEKCKRYYLSRAEYKQLLSDAVVKFPNAPKPFFLPGNIQNESGLFIPKALIDKDKYDRWHLPAPLDKYYDPSDEEYNWIVRYYLPKQSFNAKPKSESILGERGYSVKVHDEKRKSILKECIQIHGEEKVLKQLHLNIEWRMKQRNGEIRFAQSIAIWNNDIMYIEGKHYLK